MYKVQLKTSLKGDYLRTSQKCVLFLQGVVGSGLGFLGYRSNTLPIQLFSHVVARRFLLLLMYQLTFGLRRFRAWLYWDLKNLRRPVNAKTAH